MYYTSIRSWLSQLYLHPSSILLALTIHSPPHFWLLFYKWEMELFAFTGILYHTFSLPSMSNFRMFFIKQTSVSIVYGIFGSHDLSIYSLVLCPRFSKSVSFFFSQVIFWKLIMKGKLNERIQVPLLGFLWDKRYKILSNLSILRTSLSLRFIFYTLEIIILAS